MQNMRLGPEDIPVVKGVVVGAIEVVGHFSFELDTRPQVERKTAPETRVIKAGIGAVQTKIIHERAHFHVITP